MKDVLGELNKPGLTHLWTEDETIGWVYQYFNPPEERKAMRDASAAPRNSRELAVRNQFFTPRYVVEFLTDNTLGRIWYEMRKGDTTGLSASTSVQSRDGSSTIYFFNPDEPIDNLAGDLPHWRQENVTYFVTFRLSDSLPQSKLKQWREEKERWIKENPEPLSQKQKKEFYRLFPERMQSWLDAGYGSCVLSRRPKVKALIAGALNHFNEVRYHLDEYVVSSNHVHVIVTPIGGHELSSILHSWKSYTSHRINGLLRRFGNNWQKESFDHIVRNEASLKKFRKYIQGHPGSESGSKSGGSGVPPLENSGNNSGTDVYGKQRRDAAATLPHWEFENYPDKSSFMRDVPKLIMEHNLHGIDIDPRAVQIAALTLWLRAQKTWKNLTLKAPERPRIARSNIVTAEPMPGEKDMKDEFTADLKPRVLGQIVDVVFEKMKLAGEAGSLLKIEEEIKDAVTISGSKCSPSRHCTGPCEREIRNDGGGGPGGGEAPEARARDTDACGPGDRLDGGCRAVQGAFPGTRPGPACGVK